MIYINYTFNFVHYDTLCIVNNFKNTSEFETYTINYFKTELNSKSIQLYEIIENGKSMLLHISDIPRKELQINVTKSLLIYNGLYLNPYLLDFYETLNITLKTSKFKKRKKNWVEKRRVHQIKIKKTDLRYYTDVYKYYGPQKKLTIRKFVNFLYISYLYTQRAFLGYRSKIILYFNKPTKEKIKYKYKKFENKKLQTMKKAFNEFNSMQY